MEKGESTTEGIAQKAFSEIFSRFSSLKVTENKDEPVEISYTMNVQSGLKYKVWLSLQNNDELHFSVENFWLEWFPCTKREEVDVYIDAVSGFLSGKYRILEHYRGKKCVKAELQKPGGDSWKTIGTWGVLWLSFPWKKTHREIRNT